MSLLNFTRQLLVFVIGHYLYSGIACLGASVPSGSVFDSGDRAQPCYSDPLPLLPANEEVKGVPWDIARAPGGCCSSLDEVRSRIDEIDERLLDILAERCVLVSLPFHSL